MANYNLILENGFPKAVPMETLNPEKGLIGEVKMWAGWNLPDDFIWANGATLGAVAASSFYLLIEVIGAAYGTAVDTPTTVGTSSGIALVNILSGYTFLVGDMLFIDGNPFSRAIPPGLLSTLPLPYYVVSKISSTEMLVSATKGGTPLVATASVGYTAYYKVKAPDLRGRAVFCLDNLEGDANHLTTVANDGDIIGTEFGAETHLLTSAESGVPAHTHPYADLYAAVQVNIADTGSGTQVKTSATTDVARVTSANTAKDAASAHNNLPPGIVMPMIIRYR